MSSLNRRLMSLTAFSATIRFYKIKEENFEELVAEESERSQRIEEIAREKGIDISEITEEINPLISNLETINEIDSVIPDEEIPLVDLTGIYEQE